MDARPRLVRENLIVVDVAQDEPEMRIFAGWEGVHYDARGNPVV